LKREKLITQQQVVKLTEECDKRQEEMKKLATRNAELVTLSNTHAVTEHANTHMEAALEKLAKELLGEESGGDRSRILLAVQQVKLEKGNLEGQCTRLEQKVRDCAEEIEKTPRDKQNMGQKLLLANAQVQSLLSAKDAVAARLQAVMTDFSKELDMDLDFSDSYTVIDKVRQFKEEAEAQCAQVAKEKDEARTAYDETLKELHDALEGDQNTPLVQRIRLLKANRDVFAGKCSKMEQDVLIAESEQKGAKDALIAERTGHETDVKALEALQVKTTALARERTALLEKVASFLRCFEDDKPTVLHL
jgi:hypothetical protein